MATVTVHALDAGHITLPEKNFVYPHDEEASRYVPSLAFLIQHTTSEKDTHEKKTTRLLFDLGMRRDLDLYPAGLAAHCKERGPISTRPDVIESLAKGGLAPSDIDYVLYSHVHYDHVGYPRDFDGHKTKFIIGPGARDVLSGKVTYRGAHSVFEPDLFIPNQSIELPPPREQVSWDYSYDAGLKTCPLNLTQWTALSPFPHVLDVFLDGSVYIVNAPGHLPGHINLLCRVSAGSNNNNNTTTTTTTTTGASNDQNTDDRNRPKYILLAGDACHDLRLLHGTHTIATWIDEEGYKCCIHADVQAAQETIQRLKQVNDNGIEIVTPVTNTNTQGGTGKFMTMGDGTKIEIQKGWFGDPRAQEPGRMDASGPPQITKVVVADVEVVLAHDEIWEHHAKKHDRFWPGQL